MTIKPPGIDRRMLVRLGTLSGLATTIGCATGAARADAAPAPARLLLPAPTGPHRIGAVELYLVDRSRRDPWSPQIPVRELMITVFYPARTVREFPPAAQMSPGAAVLFGQIAPLGHPQLPGSGVDWAATKTHAHAGAPALPGRRPSVIYSPGGGDPRTLGTYTAEELASHGYVVVTVDHPGDACDVEFPTTTAYRDQYRTTVFRGDPRADAATYRTMIETRIADCKFVADALEALATGHNPDALGRTLPRDLGRVIDPNRLAIYGHSAGGTTAAETLHEDRRFAAAVNLEGFLDWAPATPGAPGVLLPVAERGTNRPVLLVGTSGFSEEPALDSSWTVALARSGRHATRRQIEGANHWVFTDFAPMAAQLSADGLMTAADRNALVGAIPATRAVPEVRGLLRGFLDRALAS